MQKMVDTSKDSREGVDLPSKANIQGIVVQIEMLKKGLFSKLTEILQPLMEKIDHLTISLQKVVSVAEGAIDLSIVQQEEIKTLQESGGQQADQLASLGNRQRFFILKFRALDENVERTTNLIDSVSKWLANIADPPGQIHILHNSSLQTGKSE